MARKTEYHVSHKTPEEVVGLTTKNTEEKEKQKNNRENNGKNIRENTQRNKRKDKQQNNGKSAQDNQGNSRGIWRTGDNATIFDDVLKTIQDKFPELAIPLISEAFGTTYSLNAKIIRCRDEYRTRRGKRLVDLHLQLEKNATIWNARLRKTAG